MEYEDFYNRIESELKQIIDNNPKAVNVVIPNNQEERRERFIKMMQEQMNNTPPFDPENIEKTTSILWDQWIKAGLVPRGNVVDFNYDPSNPVFDAKPALNRFNYTGVLKAVEFRYQGSNMSKHEIYEIAAEEYADQYRNNRRVSIPIDTGKYTLDSVKSMSYVHIRNLLNDSYTKKQLGDFALWFHAWMEGDEVLVADINEVIAEWAEDPDINNL